MIKKKVSMIIPAIESEDIDDDMQQKSAMNGMQQEWREKLWIEFKRD